MREEVIAHFQKFLGPGTVIWKNTEKPPIDLMFFPARGERDFHTVATIGLCEIELKPKQGYEDYRRQEFLAYLPGDWNVDLKDRKSPSSWACMFLYFAANYNREGRQFLCPGEVLHTEKTRPSTFFRYPYALLLPPLIENPAFFPLKVNGATVSFLAPVLITEEEGGFLKKNGEKQLVELLNKSEVNYFVMTPLRHSQLESTEGQHSKDEIDEAMRLIEEEDRAKAAGAAPRGKKAPGARAPAGARRQRQQHMVPPPAKPAPVAWYVSTLLAGFIVATSGMSSWMRNNIPQWLAFVFAFIVWIGLPVGMRMLRKSEKALPEAAE